MDRRSSRAREGSLSRPGLASGDPVRRGHFSVPLADFVRIFDGVIYETNRPVDVR